VAEPARPPRHGETSGSACRRSQLIDAQVKLKGDATRALSAKVRRAGLAFATELDERVEDDLTEAIPGRSIRLLTSRRGIAVPQQAADLGGGRWPSRVRRS
jgi:hypothetical protein